MALSLAVLRLQFLSAPWWGEGDVKLLCLFVCFSPCLGAVWRPVLVL